jgi:hypothetical protein
MPRHALHLLKVARYALCAGLLALAGLPAHATLITFAEFPLTPDEDGQWYSDPVGEDYAALGVHFYDIYRIEASSGTPGEGVLGGVGPGIIFTGTLPTFVSLNFSSVYPSVAAYVSAWTPHGFAGTISTGGDAISPEGTWIETPEPYVPNTYASFHSPDGISRLVFSQVYGMRTTVLIDTLYFGAVPPPPVPEPDSLALLLAGLGVVGVVRRRRHPTT